MDTKSYKEMTPEEKEKFLKRVKSTGIATTATGLVALGSGYFGSPEFKKYGKEHGYDIVGKNRKIAKLVGAGATITGAGLYGVAKYKHHKLKKNEDSKKD